MPNGKKKSKKNKKNNKGSTSGGNSSLLVKDVQVDPMPTTDTSTDRTEPSCSETAQSAECAAAWETVEKHEENEKSPKKWSTKGFLETVSNVFETTKSKFKELRHSGTGTSLNQSVSSTRSSEGYQRLEEPSLPPGLSLKIPVIRELHQNNGVSIPFYYAPGRDDSVSVFVKPGMTAAEVIAQLDSVSSIRHMQAIVEYWEDYDVERVLEDHEKVLEVFIEHVRASQNNKFRFIYKTLFERYEYMIRPDIYFSHPKYITHIDFKVEKHEPLCIQLYDPFFTKGMPRWLKARLRHFRPEKSAPPEDETNLVNPTFCSTVWVKRSQKDYTVEEVKRIKGGMHLTEWKKRYLLLRNRNLYIVRDWKLMMNCYYMRDKEFETLMTSDDKKTKQKRTNLDLMGHVYDFRFYPALNVQQYLNAPFPGGFYLRKRDGKYKRNIRMLFVCEETDIREPMNYIFKLWMTAFILATHGADIKGNIQAYQDKENEYNREQREHRDERFGLLEGVVAPYRRKNGDDDDDNDENQSHVPMDFTSGLGKIINPSEVEGPRHGGLATEEPESKIARFHPVSNPPKDVLDFGKHMCMKYYHAELRRDQAEALILKQPKEGLFLVRKSASREGSLVITYMHSSKIHHQYVTPVFVPNFDLKDHLVLVSIDMNTVFYDIHGLIDFHRLNKGQLQCILTESIKAENRETLLRETPLRNRRFPPPNLVPQNRIGPISAKELKAQLNSSRGSPQKPSASSTTRKSVSPQPGPSGIQTQASNQQPIDSSLKSRSELNDLIDQSQTRD